MLFINILKRKGPRLEPCGIPFGNGIHECVTSAVDELSVSLNCGLSTQALSRPNDSSTMP